METISLKLEKGFLQDIEKVMKQHRYSTKTELIREAIRDKLEELENKVYETRLRKYLGSSKTKTTDEEWRKIREEVGDKFMREMEKKFNIK